MNAIDNNYKRKLLNDVKEDADAIKYASKSVRHNKEILLEAVKIDGYVLCYLKKDEINWRIFITGLYGCKYGLVTEIIKHFDMENVITKKKKMSGCNNIKTMIHKLYERMLSAEKHYNLIITLKRKDFINVKFIFKQKL